MLLFGYTVEMPYFQKCHW